MKTYKLFWSPEGRCIATVTARDARAAIRKALGEIYAEEVQATKATVTFKREEMDDDSPDLSWLDQSDKEMGEGFEAQSRERLAAYKRGDWKETCERIAAQLESDAKRFEESKQLQDIGRSAFESIAEMVAALECDYDRLEELKALDADGEIGNDSEEYEELKNLSEAAGECKDREEAEQRIHDDPLSIELSGKWTIGDTPTADKAIILLGTGGPAVRIVCELSDGEPSRAWIEAQDWFKPWAQHIGGDSETLLTYCRCFYFGEG